MTKLVDEIGHFLAMTKMTDAAFGRAAVNDTRLLSDLRLGATVGYSRTRRIRDYMAANWPAGAAPMQLSALTAPEPDTSPIGWYNFASDAEAGSLALHRALLRALAGLSARNGIPMVDAAILANHGTAALDRWKARAA